MQKEQNFVVELTQSEIEGIISALDSVVKTHGLSVAEKCSTIHSRLLKAELVAEAPPQPPVIQQPVVTPPKPVDPSKRVEEVSLEEVEEELGQIMEVPKKKKKTAKKKK